ncbi:hypothetical protein ACFXTO_027860 [Malus domestica]
MHLDRHKERRCQENEDLLHAIELLLTREKKVMSPLIRAAQESANDNKASSLHSLLARILSSERFLSSFAHWFPRVVGFGTSLTGLHNVFQWDGPNLHTAAAASLVTWSLTLLAGGGFGW